jgi:biotin--protein ligase
MDVLLYFDEGVGRISAASAYHALTSSLHASYTVKRVDHQYLRWINWERQTAALVIPGGQDAPYHRLLSGRSNAKIKAFVEQGGSYLGICAGAYYGCSAIEFEPSSPIEVIATRELGFFPGIAKGPALGYDQFDYHSERGAQAAQIRWQQSLLTRVYYNGGCLFSNPEAYSSVRVLARYTDLEKDSASIVQCAVGQGTAVLCGVHPEICANTLHKLAKIDKHIIPLLEHFQDSEQSRQDLWNALLTRINLKLCN